jgi:hypothetical protein
MARSLALVAALAGLGFVQPAGALTLTFELDDLEGAYTSIAETRTQPVVVSTTRLFRATGLTLLMEADSDCAEACDPPSSFRFGFGDLGTEVRVGIEAFEGHLDLVLPIPLFRPALLRNGGLAFSLALGGVADGNVFGGVAPSAPATVGRTTIQVHGDFVEVPEPAAAALALVAGLAAWRRRGGRGAGRGRR